ncbi:MarR family transcriptional regulator [Actinomadura alba]|uniref:Helix-turn-helix domain-containing protein n=1 Tax=Actinomadura alba TaxID=406431 RepID=A0ABR7M050_9ACTN|nr:MarR family transcriptional regulator [Actinomadura alba]MBC6470406.1 helix-turn-helix domain-containing protein [Actinomadura alba]
MPGGRLTHQDRRDIGAGLTEGLGYAEIARRLGRPTSTISREVARNGGPAGYRADHAHQATDRRARRPSPAQPLEPPAAVDADGRDPEAVRSFVEQFAELMVHAGLPRMAARVLACLFTTDSGTLTAAELVQRLRVSPASVSKAVGYLEGLEVVRRERGHPRRRERYVVDDDVWIRAWTTDARRHAMWADAARRGAELFDVTTPAGARLDHMFRFFARLSDDMAGGLTEAAVGDALTVLAALVHAGAPLTVDGLATALGWPPGRVTGALDDAEQHPDITDPVALRRIPTGSYTVAARPDRLTTTQREALGQLR